VRQYVAGILVGLSSAALVLAIDLGLTAVAPGSGLQPLQTIELRTYDWRLTRTALRETARQDIAHIEIDESSIRTWKQQIHTANSASARYGQGINSPYG
jgi:hypothetical protein